MTFMHGQRRGGREKRNLATEIEGKERRALGSAIPNRAEAKGKNEGFSYVPRGSGAQKSIRDQELRAVRISRWMLLYR